MKEYVDDYENEKAKEAYYGTSSENINKREKELNSKREEQEYNDYYSEPSREQSRPSQEQSRSKESYYSSPRYKELAEESYYNTNYWEEKPKKTRSTIEKIKDWFSPTTEQYEAKAEKYKAKAKYEHYRSQVNRFQNNVFSSGLNKTRNVFQAFGSLGGQRYQKNLSYSGYGVGEQRASGRKSNRRNRDVGFGFGRDMGLGPATLMQGGFGMGLGMPVQQSGYRRKKKGKSGRKSITINY